MLSPVPESLAWAHPLVQEWFINKFGTPTEPQEQGWPHILAGRTTLISAPTGSGKTLAAHEQGGGVCQYRKLPEIKRVENELVRC